jgi:hypothetical protein
VWCSASKKRKARGYDVRGSPSPSKKSRPCDAASDNDIIEKSDSASSDESEDGDSDNESEVSEFKPEDENDGDEGQEDDDSLVGSLDSNDEALAEETQQYSLYVGYWEDIAHVVDFQVRSKSSIE